MLPRYRQHVVGNKQHVARHILLVRATFCRCKRGLTVTMQHRLNAVQVGYLLSSSSSSSSLTDDIAHCFSAVTNSLRPQDKRINKMQQLKDIDKRKTR